MIIRVMIAGEMYEVEIADLDARPILAKVGDVTFEVWPEVLSQPASAEISAPPGDAGPSLAGGNSGSGGISASGGIPSVRITKTSLVQAPIPGVILSVSVKPGDSITYGQELCVLEAMKMKNTIRSNRVGKIAAVCIQPGDQVAHGQPLVEYTD